MRRQGSVVHHKRSAGHLTHHTHAGHARRKGALVHHKRPKKGTKH